MNRQQRDREHKNGFSLAIEYYREEDGRWLADIPALPGVTAYGDPQTHCSRGSASPAWPFV